MNKRNRRIPLGLVIGLLVLLLTAARCRVDEPIRARILPKEQTVSLGTTVELYASMSYWDGKPISPPADAWFWSLDARPVGSSAVIEVNELGRGAQFVADVAGEFVVTLNVTFIDKVYVALATITVAA